MSPIQLEQKLQKVIGEAIKDFPQASPVDLVRWTRENHGDLVGQLERKWTDDKLVSLYLTAMRRRAEARTETQIESLAFAVNGDEPQKPGPKPGRDTGRKLLDRGGRPRFGHPAQNRLPFSEKFEQIPFFLVLEPRTRTSRGVEIRLPTATLKDLKKRRALIRGETSVELPQLNRLIEIMEQYDRARPGITVKEALQLRATARRQEA
jgi:hypothetical protein